MRTAAELKVRDALYAIIHEHTAKVVSAETGGTIDPDASVAANIRRKERAISFNTALVKEVYAMLEKLELRNN